MVKYINLNIFKIPNEHARNLPDRISNEKNN